MSSNDPPDHKPYAIPSTNIGPTHMQMSGDPGAAFSQRPLSGVPSFAHRTDPYGQFVPSFPPQHPPSSQHHAPPAPPPPPLPQQHHPSMSPSNPRKRRLSDPDDPGHPSMQSHPQPTIGFYAPGHSNVDMQPSATPTPQPRKKSRTNTPWTPAEEQRLKTMRDAGSSWSEIAKTFPARTEGSVKKHWYKDMHYAEFAEDESAALMAAIKEYESSKWKVIGTKVGKPAKACEQYAKENFKDIK